nr:antibiotic biosynthesis monooxygenase [Bradyrhizobium ivorense]
MQFEAVLPRDDLSRILIYEVYQDDAAFEDHRAAASIKQFREETADTVIKVIATRCTPIE